MKTLEKVLGYKNIIFYLILFLLVFSFALNSYHFDLDLWARLIVGKSFIQTGSILKSDFLSYIPTHIWYDHEWGSGVVFYLIYKIFGSFGFIILHALLIFLTFFTCTKIQKLHSVKSYNLLFYAITVCVYFTLSNFPVRCQLFSFLFFTIFLYIFELARNDKSKWLWLTPILMIIWNNLHGGCVAGIGLFLMYIMGEYLNKKDYKQYILPFIFCVVSLVINPWGIKYILFLLQATTMTRNWVVEWYSLFHPLFSNQYIAVKFYIITTILLEISFLIKFKAKLDYTKYIVLIGTYIMGFSHLKLLPFTLISILAFEYSDIKSLLAPIKLLKNKYFNMLILASVLTLCIYNFSEYTPQQHIKSYPYKSVEFIRINNIKGNLLSDFTYGSYLGYKLYPQNKIYMDGRYEEVFYPNTLPILMAFLYESKNFDTILSKQKTDIILLRNGYPVVETLINSKKWIPIYTEKNFVTLVRSKDLKENYKMPNDDEKYYLKNAFDTDINFVLQSENGK